MEIVDLPSELLLLVAAHLSARTAVLCRRVSRAWNDAFADEDISLRLLRWHFPRCREARLAFAAAVGETADNGMVISTGDGKPGCDIKNEEQGRPIYGGSSYGGDGAEGGRGKAGPSWAATFATVARRYYHLRIATSRSNEKIRHGATDDGRSGRFLPTRPWDRHLRLDDRTAPFHYPDPGWCYSQEDGLLVYHIYEEGEGECADECSTCPWRWMDVETRRQGVVPFAQGRDRNVRRVRLAAGILVFEWCWGPGKIDLNPHVVGERIRLHVSIYDVTRVTPATTAYGNTWAVIQRTEFNLPLGLATATTRYLTNSRFFSAHTNTHYAAYVWQGSRALQEDDNPIEYIYIRDMAATPERGLIRIIKRDELDFYGVRQRSTPKVRCLDMDDRNLYFTEEEHRWARGAHSSPSPPRVHLVKTTGIPVIPPAPSVPGDQGAGGGRGVGEDEMMAGSRQIADVEGPRWVDECGADGDVNMSFCARAAGRAQEMTEGKEEEEASVLAATGRPPGRAPCWRHEEFPYLTVGEIVDLRAGVRVTARHCFMLEVLSVHVRPSLRVRGLGGRVSSRGGGSSMGESSDAGRRRMGGGRAGGKGLSRKARSPRDARNGDDGENRSGGEDGGSQEEVQFADDMWDALLGKGFICGDERWLIGEDSEGSITIVRF